MNAQRLGVSFFFACVALCVVGMLGWWLFLRPPSAGEITEALDATVIPKLSLRDVNYMEAVEVVLREVRRQQPKVASVRFVVNFPVPPSPSEFPGAPSLPDWSIACPITLELNNVPAHEALKYIATLSNLNCTILDGRVCFRPMGGCCMSEVPLTFGERLKNLCRRVF